MWMILTLCGGIVLAGVSLWAYSRDAQEATTKGGGGFESHQIPLYPMLTGLSVCVLLICITMSREKNSALTDWSLAALILYGVLYFAVYRSLKKKRDDISRIPDGTSVTAEDDFKQNTRDLAWETAVGFVSLNGRLYHAFTRMDERQGMPKKGDALLVEGTDEFYLIVKRDNGDSV